MHMQVHLSKLFIKVSKPNPSNPSNPIYVATLLFQYSTNKPHGNPIQSNPIQSNWILEEAGLTRKLYLTSRLTR